jgi:translation initiation factor 1 (eIF-1/SUI1)
LNEAKKLFSNKYSCGCSVDKKTNEIDIQGDVADDLVEFISEKWNIPPSAIAIGDAKLPKAKPKAKK